MSFDRERRGSSSSGTGGEDRATAGKGTLVDELAPQADVNATVDGTEAPRSAPAAGRPLDARARFNFERAFGADFSSVRIHEQADVGAQGAVAYAQGEEIAMRPGAYDPHSSSGRELLGHELTHVLQQRAGRADEPQGKGGFHQDPVLEREADVLGARAAQGERVEVPGMVARSTGAPGGPRQAQLAVSAHAAPGAGGALRIRTVDIVGRPVHQTFPRDAGGTSEGEHATAWGVIRLGVVNRLRDRTLTEAHGILAAMHAETLALPGAQAARLATLAPARRAILTQAAADFAAAQTALAAANGANNRDAAISALQRSISAYLTYRNSIGLTVLDRGVSSTQDGEPRPMHLLQHWERAWTDANAPTAQQQTELQNAMSAMFSGEVAAHAPHAAPARLPGRLAETPAAVTAAMTNQHHASLRTAFPNITTRLAPGPIGQAWNGGALPPGADAVSTGSSSAVQVVLDAAGTIAHVLRSGRSEHGMGNSEGSHTTPHALFERALDRIVGLTPAAAITILVEIAGIFGQLPGATGARTAEMPRERVGLFAQASAALTAAQTAATAAPSVTGVQELASALLFFRNTMGLTTAHAGGVPGNNNESIHLATLDGFETALAAPAAAGVPPIDRQQLVRAIADLFDRRTLAAFNVDLDEDDDDDPRRDTRRNDTPGMLATEALEHVFVPLVRQHVMTLRAAYPHVFTTIDQALLLEIARRISEGYTAMDLGPTPYLTPTRANRVSAPPAAVAPGAVSKRRAQPATASNKSRRRRKDSDEEEWDGK